MKAIAKKQSVGMKKLPIIAALACSIIAGWTLPAKSENYFGNTELAQLRQLPKQSQQTVRYFGKIDLAKVTSQGTFFYVTKAPKHLVLSASGEHRDILLQGFYRKAHFAIDYAITSDSPDRTVGKVTEVIVEAKDF